MKKSTLLLLAGIFLFFTTFGIEKFCLKATAYNQNGLANSAWPCKGHDSRHSGQSPYIGAQTNRLKWTFQTEAQIKSSPVIDVDGTIYIGSDDKHLYAINPDGSMKWRVQMEKPVTFTPIIGANGTIYCGISGNNEYKICALNPDGSLKWSFQNEGSLNASPVMSDDGTLYFAEDSNLFAITADGSLKWIYKPEHLIISSPIIGIDGMIYFGCDDRNIFALDPMGSIKWKVQTEFSTTNYSLSIGTDSTIYIGDQLSSLYSVDRNGILNWHFKQSGINPRPFYIEPAVGSDGTVYFGSTIHNYIVDYTFSPYTVSHTRAHYKIYALSSDGEIKWDYKLVECSILFAGIPDLIDNDSCFNTGSLLPRSFSLPAIGADGTVYTIGDKGNIYALNPDGGLKWEYKTQGYQIYSSPAVGADGTVYIGSNDGKLYAFGECYLDSDNDGYGDPNQSVQTSICPQGYVGNNLDCNDKDASIYLGAPEVCDGKDNDCDGQLDIEGSQGCIIYHKDEDNDGQGINGESRCLCSANEPGNYTAIYSGDPDDQDPNIQGTIFTGNMSLPAGWSIISLPLRPDNASVSSLFPDAVVVYGFEKEMGYMRVKEEEDLEIGKGYWILLNKAKTYSILGEIIDEYKISIQDGWHMIGGCTLQAQASVDSGKIEVIYVYTPEFGYHRLLESEKLMPGKGNWILFENVTDQTSLTVQGIME